MGWLFGKPTRRSGGYVKPSRPVPPPPRPTFERCIESGIKSAMSREAEAKKKIEKNKTAIIELDKGLVELAKTFDIVISDDWSNSRSVYLKDESHFRDKSRCGYHISYFKSEYIESKVFRIHSRYETIIYDCDQTKVDTVCEVLNFLSSAFYDQQERIDRGKEAFCPEI